MKSTKIQHIIVAIAGVVTALALVIMALSVGVFTYSKTLSTLKPTYYDTEILPYIRSNIETLSGGSLDYDANMSIIAKQTTPFGQHLDSNQEIEILGKTAKDFTLNAEDIGNPDLVLLNKMLRKIYINSSQSEIMNIDRETLKSKYYHDTVTKGYAVTSLYIEGLDTLHNLNSSQITNELRFSILSFVKIYLGLMNLNEVSVVDTTIENSPFYTFILSLPTGESYTFSYVFDTGANEIAGIMVERI